MPTFSGKVVGRRIVLVVRVGPPGEPPEKPFRALLDTGATISGITQAVAEALGLPAGEWQDLEGVHGSQKAPTYKVALDLPITEPSGTFGRGVMSLEVAEMALLAGDIDVILGMDFLQDFHLTLHRDTFILSN